jgi:hypothetical protein
MSFVNNPVDAFAVKKALLEEAPSTKVTCLDNQETILRS